MNGRLTLLLCLGLATAPAYAVGQSGNTAASNTGPGKPITWTISDSQDNVPNTERPSSVFDSPSRGSGLKFPELPTPSWPTLPGFSSVKESALNAVTQTRRTTRRWWNNTVDFLNPFDDRSSSKDTAGSSATSPKTTRWWWQPQPEEPEISTVNDFLRQERPRF
ncbi:MAG: hypothetical protein KF752_19490 [Pirellulaceae bacterium]|nr:hypothetical protein [Pirellulaceae bacterium]